MSDKDTAPDATEPIEEYDTSGLLDAPNQQVVRPDGSGPADEGEGGSTAEPEPKTEAEQQVLAETAGPDLDAMTKAELIDEAGRRGITVDDTLRKDEIREALGEMYATVAELQELLKLQQPTSVQVERMERVLEAAATEIDWELGYTSLSPAPSPPPDLVVEVNLERAVEHWRQASSPFGVIGIGAEAEPIVTARNSWYRHRMKLRPLKVHQGVA